jgi:hypothetical protein
MWGTFPILPSYGCLTDESEGDQYCQSYPLNFKRKALRNAKQSQKPKTQALDSFRIGCRTAAGRSFFCFERGVAT